MQSRDCALRQAAICSLLLGRGGTPRRRLVGVAAVEFALAASVLFSALFGIIEGGRAVWMYGTASHLAKEGSRFAIVRGADCLRLDKSVCTASATDVAVYVQGRTVGCGAMTVTTTWTPDKRPGSVVRVQVDCPFQPIFWPTSMMTLRGTSQMVVTF
jgi:Flp pilus assembly protein TadG